MSLENNNFKKETLFEKIIRIKDTVQDTKNLFTGFFYFAQSAKNDEDLRQKFKSCLSQNKIDTVDEYINKEHKSTTKAEIELYYPEFYRLSDELTELIKSENVTKEDFIKKYKEFSDITLD